jgi:hypothetical protein
MCATCDLQITLREYEIESDRVQYPNDRYSLFGSWGEDPPNMDTIKDIADPGRR